MYVHNNITGPLPPGEGYTYVLTCVDNFSRWRILMLIQKQKHLLQNESPVSGFQPSLPDRGR